MLVGHHLLLLVVGHLAPGGLHALAERLQIELLGGPVGLSELKKMDKNQARGANLRLIRSRDKR